MPRTFAVHADGDAAFVQHAYELGAGELAALVRVENFRLAIFARASSSASTQKSAYMLIDTRQARTRRRRDRQSRAP
jgi:hypothetical protein